MPDIKQALFLVIGALALSMALELLFGKRFDKGALLVFEALILIPASVFVLTRRIPWNKAFRTHPVKARLLAYAVLMGAAFSVFSEQIGSLVERVLPVPEAVIHALTDLMKIRSFTDAVVLILGVVIVAGFSEEMLFRGFLQNSLERSLKPATAVFLGAFLFALMHFNPWAFLDIFLLGVWMGVLAWRSRSILPCIAIHALFNGISLWSLNTSRERLWVNERGFASPLILASSVLVFAAAAFAFFRDTAVRPLLSGEVAERR